jgi:peroxiredoxin
MLLPRRISPILTVFAAFAVVALLAALVSISLPAQEKIVWSDQEKPIVAQLQGLRKLDDDVRAKTTKDLALEIRALPVVPNKLALAQMLAGLATEGDFGHDTLQEVTTTLADAAREQPLPPGKSGEPRHLYIELASLARYEHMHVECDSPQYAAAMAVLEADDVRRQNADFTLTDLQGKSWHLRDLRGKVVLVNFWATWCPPCRKEMPDLQALYDKYKDQGFIVLALSDEEATKVAPFIEERKISYPVLLDPGRHVNDAFIVEGIPKSFCLRSCGQAGGTIDRHAYPRPVSADAGAGWAAIRTNILRRSICVTWFELV